MRVWLQMQHVQTNTLESDTLMGADTVETKDDTIDRHQESGVDVIEVTTGGWMSRLRLKLDDLVQYFTSDQDDTDTTVTCFRDLMIFLSQNKSHAVPDSDPTINGLVTVEEVKVSAIFPRRGFFLIDLMQLRIICWENRCIILDTKPASGSASGDEKLGSKSATILEEFCQQLVSGLQDDSRLLQGCACKSSWHKDVMGACARSKMSSSQKIGSQHAAVPFEMLVLDMAFYTVTAKFGRHLSLIKPIFKVLLEETVKRPSDKILRRMMAFKKSILAFEKNVHSVEAAILSLLQSDLDMSSLYLTEDREIHEHEEIELLLEGYRWDLQEIQTETRAMVGQIEETKEYINTQLNESRNRIIRMSLFIEMCMLGLTFGACFASVFGMNLKSGLEDHPFAFYLTVLSLVGASSLMIGVLIFRCISLLNLSQQDHHPILKNLLKYADVIDGMENQDKQTLLTKQGFTRQLQKEIDKNVSQEDVDLIFQVFDDFNKGYLKKSEFQIIMNEIRR